MRAAAITPAVTSAPMAGSAALVAAAQL
jgi:hypothetical protein